MLRQSTQTADAVEADSVVFQVAEAVGAFDTVDAFLQRVCDILIDRLKVDRLVLLLHDSESEALTPAVSRLGPGHEHLEKAAFPPPPIIDYVRQSKVGVLCANTLTDERFRIGPNGNGMRRAGPRSILSVPVLARNQLYGVLYMDCSTSRQVYSQDQFRLVSAVGRLAGLAVDHARLLETQVRTARLAAVGETVAYLSHYIRNILQGIQGGTEVVELGFRKRNWETAESGWSLVRRNLDRTLNLAMNILTFSKDRRPRVELADLSRIVSDVAGLSRIRADEKHVHLVSNLEELPLIPMDPDGIHQVVQNILNNAIEAAPAQTGSVVVGTRLLQVSDEVEVVIQDNGPGIPPEQLENIFSVFHSSKGHGGTGLGLAAARKIVTELEGRIEIESHAATGTIFHVVLPIRPRLV